MILMNRIQISLAILISFAILFIFLSSISGTYLTPATNFSSNTLSYSIASATTSTSTNPSSSSADIGNHTLGFEKVFVISLPERSDKRDALTLMSSLSGFKIDWIDGVRGETIPDKDVPFGTDRAQLWENNLGSWRGHMNAVRSILENDYSSVLIMEDDMDWDVRLKSQLEKFAKGSRFLQAGLGTPTQTFSPYGDDWDLLWLGHCGEVFPEDLPENAGRPAPPKYTISPDETLPPPDKVTGLLDFKRYPNTRFVHTAGGPICTFAYALSYSGAQKVLFDLSVDHLLGPFDNALANLCRYGRRKNEDSGLGMRCFSVNPPLFFHHRAKGYVGGDSDIQKVGGDGENQTKEMREKGYTENIVWSTRENLQNLILGLEPESQFE